MFLRERGGSPLDKLRFGIVAAVLAFMLIGTASAQTAANITILSGNGQLTCQLCPINPFFLPLVVKVTDASGAPIPSKTVNWTLISSSGPAPLFAPQSITDINGIASTFFSQVSQPGSFFSGFLQSVLQASADSATATFYETQGLALTTSTPLVPLVTVRLDSPLIGTILSGTAGGTADTPVQVHVDAFGTPVPNVSVRVVNTGDPKTTASVSCATGAGADPGSVLTDQFGNANCTLIFGPIAGTGSFSVYSGGVDPATSSPDVAGTTVPVAYSQSLGIQLDVKAGVPGLVSVSSGNNQNVNPGQSTAPLIAKVTDSTGVSPIPGATVVWSVTPAGAVTFNPTSSTSDSSGLAQTVATLSSSAVGPITIKATLSTASNLSATFNVTANVQLTGLQKVSGDQQSVPAGQPAAQPLIVQVNGSNGQPVANYPVSFSASGPGTISASSVTTGSNGRAQVTVTAGSTPGTLTVTASAGSFTQSFTITVLPPGPNLTTSSFFNGADFQQGALSACGIATIIASGIAPNVQGVVVPTSPIGPLPYTLANVKVTFANSQAPIYNVANVNGQQQVTVQVPCDVTAGSSVPVTVSVAGGNGTINVPILPAAPGIFHTLMSDGVSRAVAVRPDGSFVSLENPARRGEVIRTYVTGLGAIAPPLATNSVPVSGTDSNVTGQVIVGVNNFGVRLISAKAAQNLIGIQEVTFQVPNDAVTGNNVIFSVGINAVGDTQTRYSAGTSIPIL
jgi:uncharacterized protein (TIGR03437 family)